MVAAISAEQLPAGVAIAAAVVVVKERRQLVELVQQVQ